MLRRSLKFLPATSSGGTSTWNCSRMKPMSCNVEIEFRIPHSSSGVSGSIVTLESCRGPLADIARRLEDYLVLPSPGLKRYYADTPVMRCLKGMGDGVRMD